MHECLTTGQACDGGNGNSTSSGATSFEGGVSGHCDHGFDLNLPSYPTDFWAAGLGDGKLIEFNRAPSVIQECFHCSQNGNNSSTCPNRGIKLFGVPVRADDAACAIPIFSTVFDPPPRLWPPRLPSLAAASSSPERNNACTSKEFSPEEEEIIIRAHEFHGSNWLGMAIMLTERTGEEIKNHWDRILKKRLADKGFEDGLLRSGLQVRKNLPDNESEVKHKNKLERPWPLFTETSSSNGVTDSKSWGRSSSRSEISMSWGFSGPSCVN